MQTVAVIGLGYVGLPLVIEFGKHARTIGFDIVEAKVAKCREGVDPSREISNADMALAVHAEYTSDPAALREADFILIAVPTPVDDAHIPNFAPLVGASRSVGPYLKRFGTPQTPADLARFHCLALSSDASQTRGWAFKQGDADEISAGLLVAALEDFAAPPNGI